MGAEGRGGEDCGGRDVGGVWGNCKSGGGEEVNVKAKHNDSHQMGMTLYWVLRKRESFSQLVICERRRQFKRALRKGG